MGSIFSRILLEPEANLAQMKIKKSNRLHKTKKSLLREPKVAVL
jgi:hypothetical protein